MGNGSGGSKSKRVCTKRLSLKKKSHLKKKIARHAIKRQKASQLQSMQPKTKTKARAGEKDEEDEEMKAAPAGAVPAKPAEKAAKKPNAHTEELLKDFAFKRAQRIAEDKRLKAEQRQAAARPLKVGLQARDRMHGLHWPCMHASKGQYRAGNAVAALPGCKRAGRLVPACRPACSLCSPLPLLPAPS
jgi:hypothetical protein